MLTWRLYDLIDGKSTGSRSKRMKTSQVLVWSKQTIASLGHGIFKIIQVHKLSITLESSHWPNYFDSVPNFTETRLFLDPRSPGRLCMSAICQMYKIQAIRACQFPAPRSVSVVYTSPQAIF